MVHSSPKAIFLIVSSFCTVVSNIQTFQTAADLSEYGVDVSYPVHHFFDEKG